MARVEKISKKMKEKNLDYYLNLPYQIIIQHVQENNKNYYYGEVLELYGCQSDGETLEELYENIREDMKGWLYVKLENNDPIPEPLTDESYSGKFVIRIPKSLHKRLSIEAEKEGVSLNQYALYKLAR